MKTRQRAARTAGRLGRRLLAAAGLVLAVIAALIIFSAFMNHLAHPHRHHASGARPVPARAGDEITPQAPPAGWHQLSLPNGTAALSYPPGWHRVTSDADAVSVARVGSGGRYLRYLNATPHQGGETLANWPRYRLALLSTDDAASVRLDAAATHQHFRGGTGSCVTDSYLTKIGHHRYTELACLVRGQAGTSVIVAAAPTAAWHAAEPVLRRAVAAYQVR